MVGGGVFQTLDGWASFFIWPEAGLRGTMTFDLTLYPKGRVSKTVKSGFKNLFEKLLSECTQKQSYVICSIAKCGKYSSDYEAPSREKKKSGLTVFGLRFFSPLMHWFPR